MENKRHDRIFFNIPFDKKDDAKKQLKIYWDGTRKLWYTTEGLIPQKFTDTFDLVVVEFSEDEKKLLKMSKF